MEFNDGGLVVVAELAGALQMSNKVKGLGSQSAWMGAFFRYHRCCDSWASCSVSRAEGKRGLQNPPIYIEHQLRIARHCSFHWND
jgi:hypothetical protein